VKVRALSVAAVIAVGCGCRSKPRPTPVQAPVDAAVSTLGASADAAKPATRVSIAQGKDEFPRKPRTPEETLSSVPDFQRPNGYASPVSNQADLANLVHRATTVRREGPTGLGLLVCRAGTQKDVEGTLKTLALVGAADLDFEIHFKDLVVKQSGPDEAQSAAFTLPLVSLTGGETVSVKLWDRDGASRKPVGDVRAIFGGTLPFFGEKDRNHLVCGHVAQSEVDVFAAAAVQRADAALDALADDLSVDEWGEDLGLGPLNRTCRKSTSEIAALIGWGDSVVDRRVDWCTRMESTLAGPIAAFVRVAETQAAAISTASTEIDGRPVSVGRAVRHCSPGAAANVRRKFGLDSFVTVRSWPCIVRVPVTNNGPSPLRANSLASDVAPIATLTTLSAAGRTKDSGLLGIEGAAIEGHDQMLAPGASGTLVFGADAGTETLVEIRGAPSVEPRKPHVYLPLATDDAPRDL